ncbi:MAG: hypothetical protein BWY72_01595 [Bacteroidetes bacterium ADurb.Bin416]|nr:MAG: hypothetical protein BWY72_01595 [Bacteroidetes bacterium ADurb.Bin416]
MAQCVYISFVHSSNYFDINAIKYTKDFRIRLFGNNLLKKMASMFTYCAMDSLKKPHNPNPHPNSTFTALNNHANYFCLKQLP